MRLFATLLLFVAAVAASAADPLCGRWRMTSGGAEIEIAPHPTDADTYSVTLYHSEDYTIPAATPIGQIRRTATPGRYVATLCDNPTAPFPKKRSLVVSVRTDGTLGFEPYSKGRRISLWRWIPYLFRVTVIERGHQPSDTEGAVPVDRTDLSRHRTL